MMSSCQAMKHASKVPKGIVLPLSVCLGISANNNNFVFVISDDSFIIVAFEKKKKKWANRFSRFLNNPLKVTIGSHCWKEAVYSGH